MGVLALLWGSSFLWIKLALGGLPPAWIAAVRCALGAAVVLGLCAWGRRRLPSTWRAWGHVAVAALFGCALPFLLFAVGEQTVDSGVAGVLNATTPLFALVIGVALGTDRRLSPVRLGGLLLGFAGVVLIFAPWHAAGLASWGALAILTAAASYAVGYAYIGRTLANRGTDPIALSAAQLTTATAMGALTLPFSDTGAIALDPVVLLAIGVLGVLGTGVAFAINLRLITDEGATQATTVGYLLPVVSVLLGALFLHEPLTTRVVAGMLVVLLGVGMTRVVPRRPAPAAPAPELAKA
ncbi:DMT family transporter [Actinokineospora bangkokensis]|uniref:Multidrug transporter n=1 Tax=Actinokineospora bangkokensis TaxID=1193682 RepID=A0A1Q9LGJ6_9PSEU|nr:DMT family transporter [Actinokineospora bangkokensis]OLR91134.1 multidrug transporter [Actinokineospora bangkokensis]